MSETQLDHVLAILSILRDDSDDAPTITTDRLI